MAFIDNTIIFRFYEQSETSLKGLHTLSYDNYNDEKCQHFLNLFL